MNLQLSKTLPSLFIAFVFIQSLFFKFSGSYETQFIFQTLGVWSGFTWFANWGAYMVGSAELVASILLFTRWHGLGAVMSVGIMSGAIYFHLFTPLGIPMPEFNDVGEIIGNDSGLLFIMACLIWLNGVYLLIRDWYSPQSTLQRMIGRNQ
ncbi:hypothetical protein EC575_23425 [Vibrio cholerae]|nr:hypothetical protein [Vibrio cholerae]EJL6335041.1 hypothetical protein [Vibrio cholerae]EKF9572967.1 hypothetical protein [Vibrio cholerae]RND29793.1 hypothetical protein EC575_23425 [Vibrio cholerae]